MKKILFLYIFCFTVLCQGKAQSFIPFATWNNAGVSGIYLQPASIADTRLTFDMTVLGVDANVGNSFYGMKRGFLFSGNGDGRFDDYKTPLTKVDNHRGQIGADVQLLNFMVPLSAKSAFGFTSRLRYMLNVDGVDPDMFNVLEHPVANNYKSYTISDLAFRTNAWAEFGFTYAREILNLNQHYLKAGLTFKLIQPVTSAYIYIEDAGYELLERPEPGSSDLEEYVKVKASGELAFPTGFNDFDDFTDIGKMFDDFKFGKNMGVGFDLGAVYEYRPDQANDKPVNERQSFWKRYEPSKYLFRVGVSVLDIGSMKYHSDWTQGFNMSSAKEILEDDVTDLNSLRELFGLKEQSTQYRIALPSAISIQADWRINQLFYLAVNPYFALHQKKGNNVGTHYMTNVSVIPRLELEGMGVSLPITYDQFKAFNVGLGFRMGPLWIGSGNIFNILVSNKLREVNLCMAMKITIHPKRAKKQAEDMPKLIDTIE